MTVSSGSQYLVNGLTHYQRNRDTYIQKSIDRKAKIVQHMRDVKVASGCVDCGNKDWRVLEFDHLRDKLITPSRMINKGWSIERIDKELDKCEVRCANCHRIITVERREQSSLDALLV